MVAPGTRRDDPDYFVRSRARPHFGDCLHHILLYEQAIRAFNMFVHKDQRAEMVLLPIGDGLTLARKIV